MVPIVMRRQKEHQSLEGVLLATMSRTIHVLLPIEVVTITLEVLHRALTVRRREFPLEVVGVLGAVVHLVVEVLVVVDNKHTNIHIQ